MWLLSKKRGEIILSKYTIIHGQLCELPEDELMHWKYIKREKVNGKWKYYYDQSELDRFAKTANDSKNKSIDAARRVFESQRKEKEALQKYKKAWADHTIAADTKYAFTATEKADRYKAYTNAKTDLDYQKQNSQLAKDAHADAHKKAERDAKKYKTKEKISAPARAVAKSMVNAGNKLSDYTYGVKRDWEESKERGTKKAIEEATKNDGAFIKSKHGFVERGDTTFTDTDKILSGKTTLLIGDTELREIRRGKLERLTDTAKEYVKDRLGYDEKDTVKTAIAKYEYAKNAEKNYVNEANATINFMGTVNPRDGSIRYTDAQKKEIARLEREKQLLRNQTAEAEKEASEASKAYLNTTVGKIEKARNNGEEWIKQLFGRNKRNKR